VVASSIEASAPAAAAAVAVAVAAAGAAAFPYNPSADNKHQRLADSLPSTLVNTPLDFFYFFENYVNLQYYFQVD
jgi:hypothetical protein